MSTTWNDILKGVLCFLAPFAAWAFIVAFFKFLDWLDR